MRILFFCAKQKAAYEMRISDWSAYVCSSDLDLQPARLGHLHVEVTGEEHGADVRLPDGKHVILAPVAAHLDKQLGLAVTVQGPVVRGAEFFQEIEGVDRMVLFGHEFDHCRSEERRVGKGCVSRVALGGQRII